MDLVGVSIDRIDKIAAIWKTTDKLASAEADADTTMLTRIAVVLKDIDETRKTVVDHRNDLFSVRDNLVNPSIKVGESIEQLQATVETRLAGIFRAEHPPLWNARTRESLQAEWQTIGPEFFSRWLKESSQFARKSTHTIGFQLGLFVVLGLTLLRLRERTRKRAEADDSLKRAQLVFEHP